MHMGRTVRAPVGTTGTAKGEIPRYARDDCRSGLVVGAKLEQMTIPNPYRGLKGLPGDVWMIAATSFVNRMGMMALPFLVLYLTEYLHVSAPRAGLAIS